MNPNQIAPPRSPASRNNPAGHQQLADGLAGRGDPGRPVRLPVAPQTAERSTRPPSSGNPGTRLNPARRMLIQPR